MKGYRIQRLYLVHCERCNEEITRAQLGTYVDTRAEAEDVMREHDETCHPKPGRETP